MENSQISNVKSNRDLKLAPETIRIRDAIVEKYLETPLDTLSSKLQSLISEETDTVTRLGVLSARVEILRMRFAEITGRTYSKDQGSNEDNGTEEEQTDEASEEEKEGWMTLRILEASEVNGVRFPEGVKIDVHTEDAKKLLASKKAELLSMKVEDLVDPEQLNEEDPIEEENTAIENNEELKTESEVSTTEQSSEKSELEGVKVEELTDPSGDKADVQELEVQVEAETKKKSVKESNKNNGDSGGNEEGGAEVQEKAIPSEGEDKQSEAAESNLEDNKALNPEELSDLTEDQTVVKEPQSPDSDTKTKSSQGPKIEEDSDNSPAEEGEKKAKVSAKGAVDSNNDKP